MSELLTCEGLTKSYQKGTNALDSIDLHIGFGRIVGLLGPNGSGKTTLIKLANGLLQPTAGSIKVAGMAPGPDTKAIVSYLPDAQWLPDWMRVEQLVEMFRDFYADFDTAKASEMRRGPGGTGLHPEHHPHQLQPGCLGHPLHPPHRGCGAGAGRGGVPEKRKSLRPSVGGGTP